MNIPIAVQLYTVRNETSKDFIGTLEKVSEMGYEGVEFAGYGNLSAEELRKHLDRLNLKVAGSHISLDDLLDNLDEIIKFNIAINNKNIVCPWAKWETKSEFIDIANKLKGIGVKCKEKGLNFYYHNHAHEFEKLDDVYGLDLLYSTISENNLKIELDTHWVERAGVNPIEYMKKYKKRCSLVHLKDMTKINGKKTFAAVGEGTMNIKGIIKTAEEIGAKWIIVENDDPKPNGIDNITASINFLKKINY